MKNPTKEEKSKSNPQTPKPDSWDSRIDYASTFLGISHENVLVALRKLGVTEEPAGMEMLSDEEVVPFGDLRKIFCDEMEIPLAKVRMAMKYLRGPKDSAKTDTLNPETVKFKEKYGVKLKLEHIPTDQLLEDYDPKQSDSPITIVLKKRFGNKAVIVFKPETTEVDIEATANYIADLEQGFPEEDTVKSQGELVRLNKVGKVPDQIIDEDPLFPNTPLKRGRSIVNRANWANISIECRQFARIAVETGEIDPDDKRDVKDVMKLVNCEAELDMLKEEYPEASVLYREQKKLNSLPNLVMTMEQANAAKAQNPFNINRKY